MHTQPHSSRLSVGSTGAPWAPASKAVQCPARTAAHAASEVKFNLHGVQPTAQPALVLPSAPQVVVPAKRPSLINLATPGISRRHLLQGGLATIGLATCPCCPSPAQAADWDYEANGPGRWAGACASGTRQSPVDLPVSPASSPNVPNGPSCLFGDIQFKYAPDSAATVLNTGHGTMQVNFNNSQHMAELRGMELQLVQFHFHSPSEHSMNGKRAPMEVHLVHRVQGSGGLAVIGVMIEGGAAQPHATIQAALTNAPPAAKAEAACPTPIDPTTLLPPDDGKGHRPYVHYTGSLTTPPCAEGVDWFVMAQALQCSDRQILDFMRFVGNNATLGLNSRPIQPMNVRQFDCLL